MKVKVVENEIQVFTDEKKILQVFKNLPEYPLFGRLKNILNRIEEGASSFILPDGKSALACLSGNIFIISLVSYIAKTINVGIIRKSSSWKAWTTVLFRREHFETLTEAKLISKKARLSVLALIKEQEKGNSDVDSLKSLLSRKF